MPDATVHDEVPNRVHKPVFAITKTVFLARYSDVISLVWPAVSLDKGVTTEGKVSIPTRLLSPPVHRSSVHCATRTHRGSCQTLHTAQCTGGMPLEWQALGLAFAIYEWVGEVGPETHLLDGLIRWNTWGKLPGRPAASHSGHTRDTSSEHLGRLHVE